MALPRLSRGALGDGDVPSLLPLPAFSRRERWPEVMRVGKLALTFTGCRTQDSSSALLLGRALEVTLGVKVWVSWPEVMRTGRLSLPLSGYSTGS